MKTAEFFLKNFPIHFKETCKPFAFVFSPPVSKIANDRGDQMDLKKGCRCRLYGCCHTDTFSLTGCQLFSLELGGQKWGACLLEISSVFNLCNEF